MALGSQKSSCLFSKLQFRGYIIKCALCFAEIFCISGCSLKRRNAAGAKAFLMLVPVRGAGQGMGGMFGRVNVKMWI